MNLHILIHLCLIPRMDIAKNEITGINRIIFEYCHFPLHFGDELKEKTKLIYKTLNFYSSFQDLAITNNEYTKESVWKIELHGTSNKKWNLLTKLKNIKSERDKMMGYGRIKGGYLVCCNKCYYDY